MVGDSFPYRILNGSQFLKGYWPEATLSSLPLGPIHRATQNIATCSFNRGRQRGRKKEGEREGEKGKEIRWKSQIFII